MCTDAKPNGLCMSYLQPDNSDATDISDGDTDDEDEDDGDDGCDNNANQDEVQTGILLDTYESYILYRNTEIYLSLMVGRPF